MSVSRQSNNCHFISKCPYMGSKEVKIIYILFYNVSIPSSECRIREKLYLFIFSPCLPSPTSPHRTPTWNFRISSPNLCTQIARAHRSWLVTCTFFWVYKSFIFLSFDFYFIIPLASLACVPSHLIKARLALNSTLPIVGS